MSAKRKILIIGSSGMLGIDLYQELKKGYEVTGIDVSPSKGRYIKCDITDRNKIFGAVMKAKPDIVIHAAAMTDVDGCELNPKRAYKINGEGTKNVALACKAADATLVYISTDFIFDGKKKSPYKESDKPAPLSVYGDSKLKGELAVKKFVKKYFILRTSWLYGANGKNFVDTIIAKAKELGQLKVVDDQVGSPTYTKDLAIAVRKLISRDTGYGIYHVSNSGSVSWFDYAKEMLKLTGSGTKVIPISSKELNRPARRPAMSVLDNSKFNKFTGYRMRNWQEALKNYVR